LAHNTTAASQSTTLTCVANGVPSTYTYIVWEHIWAWNKYLLRYFSGTETLNFEGLSYASSGVYTCKVANGVRYSQNPNYGVGSAYLEVKGNTITLNRNKCIPFVSYV